MTLASTDHPRKSFLVIIYNESKVSLIYCLQFKFHLCLRKLSLVKQFTVTCSFVCGKTLFIFLIYLVFPTLDYKLLCP